MKINQHIEKIEEVKVCHPDATNCHKTVKAGARGGIGYICPKLKNLSNGNSYYRKENL